MSSSHNFWLGMDVHKESVTAAVIRDRDAEPLRVDRLPYDLKKIRRYVQRLQAEGTVRACYEASGPATCFSAPSLSGASCAISPPRR